LHAELLPESPVVLLGDRFMKQFYYGKLLQARLILGATAYVDHTPAGFIVATHEASSFMKRAIEQHGVSLIRVLLGQLMSNPARISSVWEALKIMRHTDGAARGSQLGELLSFGVKEEFRDRRFVAETGIRVSVDLLNLATQQLTARGVRKIRAVVDPAHMESKLFYAAMGWQ
jgi:hypothetical protein